MNFNDIVLEMSNSKKHVFINQATTNCVTQKTDKMLNFNSLFDSSFFILGSDI